VSQRQTIASGMMMRVKMKMPKLERRMRPAYMPARMLEKARRAKASMMRARARTVKARGRRAAAVRMPKSLKLAAMDQ